jgi:hypothetical protein
VGYDWVQNVGGSLLLNNVLGRFTKLYGPNRVFRGNPQRETRTRWQAGFSGTPELVVVVTAEPT